MRINPTKVAGGLLLLLGLSACDMVDPDFLERDPTSLLTDDQVWNDVGLVEGVLANLYYRLPETKTIFGEPDDVRAAIAEPFAELDEAMWSGRTTGPNSRVQMPYGGWNVWNYQLIRDINLFIEKVQESTELRPVEIRELAAEGRFLRAYVYFEHVKRVGGVPLITETYEYDFSGDPGSLQFPRNTEAEVYDFVAAELDAIVDDLPAEKNYTRATKWTALAMKSRAMLYAGSIAKYNNLMPSPIQLPGEEVGIPSSRAEGYYEQALAAAKEIIQSGTYQLYDLNPDRGRNFYEAITSKQNNPEVIWATDFDPEALTHLWTYSNLPASMGGAAIDAAVLSPSLNLVESYEYLDGTSGEMVTEAADGDFVYYDQPEDIFANRDPRLWGTIVYPGAELRGEEVSVQAGVLVWNPATGAYTTVSSNQLGALHTDGGLLVGRDGPLATGFSVTNTGFHVRKFIDPRPNTQELSIGSDVWWVRYRYAEVLLNAAEAALELGQQAEALGYVNQVRERAGFGPSSLSSLTIDRLRNERRVELAFENHRLYDMKRWRLAHEVWNGDRQSETAMLYALWPYRVVRPGDPRDGKYVYMKLPAPRLEAPRFFRMGNYYSAIPQGVLDANPKIVENPFH